MTSRHLEDIDKAVHLARRAALTGRLRQPQALTRFLYRHWWLGRPTGPDQHAPTRARPAARPVSRSAVRPSVPPQGRHPAPWRVWSPQWAGERTCTGAGLVRLYLVCAPHTTLHAVAAVQARAEQWDVPWLLSTRAMSQAVPSPDATVLYLPADALAELRGPLTRLVEDVHPFLATTVPLLTLRIARGAALAQNPQDGSSFGEHRCGIIATAALETLHVHHREAVQRTYAAFAHEHVDPRRPYRELDASWEWDRRATAA
jgi:hypothetical protein